jgi:predicted glycosyltransferase
VRILVDISHPAHVHFFRNAISRWLEHGHLVRVVARDKDITLDLLNRFHIPHKVLSKARTGVLGWTGEMLVHTARLLPLILTFKPHVMLQIGGIFVCPVGRLTLRPAWAFTDTENAALSNFIAFRFAHRVFTPQCYNLSHGSGHLRYPGFHELAYLHPRHFLPDPSVLSTLGLEPADPFFIVRFVAWKSAHDIGQRGFSLPNKIKLVSELARHGRVFVSSEAPLPPSLKTYASQIPVEQIHHFIAHASLVVGESATMASEAAVLGIPSIFVSPTGRGYTDVQERRYGLVFNFKDSDQDNALNMVREFIATSYPKDHWEKKRRRLLEDSIDVTGWLVRMVERFGVTHDAEASASWAFRQVNSEERETFA